MQFFPQPGERVAIVLVREGRVIGHTEHGEITVRWSNGDETTEDPYTLELVGPQPLDRFLAIDDHFKKEGRDGTKRVTHTHFMKT